MKTLNTDVNTSRMVGNNGTYFLENGTFTGVAYGFMPHNLGCIVTAVTIKDGNSVEGSAPNWVNTTLNLDAWTSAGLVGSKKGYITSLTVTGACTLYLDSLAVQ